MIQVIKKGIISEHELMDFIHGYEILVEADVLSKTVFEVVLTNLGIQIGKDGEYILDKNTSYKLKNKKVK